MRLTADLITNSLSYINPLKERELDLRGHKIPAIENLGVAKDQDAIDFTDNDISQLANFPLSPRLRSLYFARNRVSSIQPTIARSVPNLTTIVLTQNNLSDLADLDPLHTLKKLTHLCLADNPAASKEDYRYWIIWRCPSVRFLDFARVTDAERNKAKELFGTIDEPSEAAQTILASRTNKSSALNASTATTNGASKGGRVKLTDEERKRVEKLIRNAKSLAEITKLEKELSEGRIPSGAMDVDMT